MIPLFTFEKYTFVGKEFGSKIPFYRDTVSITIFFVRYYLYRDTFKYRKILPKVSRYFERVSDTIKNKTFIFEVNYYIFLKQILFKIGFLTIQTKRT